MHGEVIYPVGGDGNPLQLEKEVRLQIQRIAIVPNTLGLLDSVDLEHSNSNGNVPPNIRNAMAPTRQSPVMLYNAYGDRSIRTTQMRIAPANIASGIPREQVTSITNPGAVVYGSPSEAMATAI